MIKKKLKEGFLKDVLLNLLASTISVIALQLAIYPLINYIFGKSALGEILTFMGIVNIAAVMFGTALNNVRLISNNEYEDKKISGDFMPLLLISTFVNIAILIVALLLVKANISSLESILLIVCSMLTMYRSYFAVAYRLKINFRLILMHSLFYLVGLFVGAMIMWVSKIWILSFLIGEIFSFIFLLKTTDLVSEPFKLTDKFSATMKHFVNLSLATCIANVLVYLDRLIVLPILGSRQVAVYFAATTIGKMSSFVLQPISGVLLTYFAKDSRKMKNREFWLINGGVLFFSILALLGCVIVSRFFLKLLYPSLYTETLPILILANAAAILTASGTITQSILLRYCATFWQVVIQIVYAATYIGLGILLIMSNGLYGFALASLVSALVRMILMFVVGTMTLKGEVRIKSSSYT